MDPSQRLHLDQLLKNFDGEETTEQIRNLKHSKLIFTDVKTLENIGQELGLSRERVRQIEKRAKERLKSKLQNEAWINDHE